jgi:ribosomal protein S18 acetylase RimI-like enzyme
MAGLEIVPALTPADIAAAKALTEAYAASLGFDLGYQDFAAELAGFPGKYAPPGGALLLGRLGGRPMGVVALRDLGLGFCEMKRLYVRPAARGSGLGLALAEAAVAAGRRLGFRAMRLDTVPGEHDRAIALYRRLGFRAVAPYYDSPIAGTLFFQLDYD